MPKFRFIGTLTILVLVTSLELEKTKSNSKLRSMGLLMLTGPNFTMYLFYNLQGVTISLP